MVTSRWDPLTVPISLSLRRNTLLGGPNALLGGLDALPGGLDALPGGLDALPGGLDALLGLKAVGRLMPRGSQKLSPRSNYYNTDL